MEVPHNCVLFRCSSVECHHFLCNTNELHSNCFERFKRTKSSDANSMHSESADEKKRSYNDEHCTFL